MATMGTGGMGMFDQYGLGGQLYTEQSRREWYEYMLSLGRSQRISDLNVSGGAGGAAVLTKITHQENKETVSKSKKLLLLEI